MLTSANEKAGNKACFITWFADPIFQDFEEKKICFFNFFYKINVQLSVPRPDKGGGPINYGVLGTQELESTDIGKKQGMGTDDLLIVLTHNGGSKAEA